jgi:large subunit ribosomal protein L22
MANTEKPATKAAIKKLAVEAKPEFDKNKLAKDILKQQTSDKLPKPLKESSSKNETEQKPKSEDKQKEEKRKPIQKKPIVKKEEVVVNGKSLPISTKYSMAICKFIKGKKIDKAIEDLEQVIAKKKAVPVKGEIPHRKGEKMMSGRFPKRASENFIKLLKSLQANANNHNVEKPIIVEAVANLASRPFGRFGRVRKKRTHITIKAREKRTVKNKSKSAKNRNKGGIKKR